MPVPWLQIVQLVPSILDVSRELLRKQKSLPPPPISEDGIEEAVVQRLLQLEENERRQAELINQMAEQNAQFARAVTVLHRRALWLTAGLSIAIILGVIGIVR